MSRYFSRKEQELARRWNEIDDFYAYGDDGISFHDTLRRALREFSAALDMRGMGDRFEDVLKDGAPEDDRLQALRDDYFQLQSRSEALGREKEDIAERLGDRLHMVTVMEKHGITDADIEAGKRWVRTCDTYREEAGTLTLKAQAFEEALRASFGGDSGVPRQDRAASDAWLREAREGFFVAERTVSALDAERKMLEERLGDKLESVVGLVRFEPELQKSRYEWTEKAKAVGEAFASGLRRALDVVADWGRKISEASVNIPFSAADGRTYDNANRTRLVMASVEQGYTDDRWMSYRQIEDFRKAHPDQDVRIRDGEQGTRVFLPQAVSFIVTEDGQKEVLTQARLDELKGRENPPAIQEGVLLTPSTVYNAQQIENFPAREHPAPELTAEERQNVLAGLKAPEDMSGALDAAVQRIREKSGPQEPEPASRIRLR